MKGGCGLLQFTETLCEVENVELHIIIKKTKNNNYILYPTCRGPSISSHRVRVYILWSLFKFVFPTKKDTINMLVPLAQSTVPCCSLLLFLHGHLSNAKVLTFVGQENSLLP